MNTEISINRIILSDLPLLQNLARQTFSETFALTNTEENMQHYLATSFATDKLATEINNPYSALYFAKVNSQAVGYLKVNHAEAQTELHDSNSLEVERIYVLQAFHGQYVGQLLLQRALNIANNSNLNYLWLGVWEKNLRAIRFYEKNGFIRFATHTFKLGNDEQTDIMMKLKLKE